MLNITLFVALPEEYRSFRKTTGQWRHVCRRPFRKFSRTVAGRQLDLVETGMGRERVGKALDWAIKENLPDIICSFGFAGSVSHELQVGQVISGNRFVLSEESGKANYIDMIRWYCAADSWLNFCEAHGVRSARIVTEKRPESKRSLRLRLGETASVVDMETYHIARFAQERAIPFVGFRAISDGPEDELKFDLGEIATEGRIRPARVMLLLARKPQLLPEFYSLWKKSTQAALELARVVSAFTNLPSPQMREFLSGCRLTE